MTSGGNEQLRVGKFKGRTYQDVFNSEKHYVTWALGLPGPSGEMLKFQTYCKQASGMGADTRVGAQPDAMVQPAASSWQLPFGQQPQQPQQRPNINTQGSNGSFPGTINQQNFANQSQNLNQSFGRPGSQASGFSNNRPSSGGFSHPGTNTPGAFAGGGFGQQQGQHQAGFGQQGFGGPAQFGGAPFGNAAASSSSTQFGGGGFGTQFGAGGGQFGASTGSGQFGGGQFAAGGAPAPSSQFGFSQQPPQQQMPSIVSQPWANRGSSASSSAQLPSAFAQMAGAGLGSATSSFAMNGINHPPPQARPANQPLICLKNEVNLELTGHHTVALKLCGFEGSETYRALRDLLPGGQIRRGVTSCLEWPISYKDALLQSLNNQFRQPEGNNEDDIAPWIQKIQTLIKQKEERQARNPPINGHVFHHLHKFQDEGVAFAVGNNGKCIIGDEMGCGKTVQSLATAWYFREDSWPVLVVCPSTLRSVWADEVEQWLTDPMMQYKGRKPVAQVIKKGADKLDQNADFVIVSYALLASKDHFKKSAAGLPWKMLIADEAHYIKDPKSKRGEVVLKIAKDAKRAILLSGTPALNQAAELYPLLDIVLPPKSIPNQTQYQKRFCFKIEQNFGGRRVINWKGAKRTEELHFILQSCMIRRLKSEVLSQLPPKTRSKVRLQQDELDKGKLKELQKTIKMQEEAMEYAMEQGEGRGPSPQMMKLFQLTGEAKVPAVISFLTELLENSPKEKKFLIFAHHMAVLDAIDDALQTKIKIDKQAIGFMRIDGRTPQDARGKLVHEFQETPEVRVAVLSITACGTGLTLTASDHVIFAELYWVPGQMMQAEDRVHRIGQTNNVTIQYLCAPDTVDEKMFKMLDRKRQDTSAVVDGRNEKMDLEDTTHQPLPKRQRVEETSDDEPEIVEVVGEGGNKNPARPEQKPRNNSQQNKRQPKITDFLQQKAGAGNQAQPTKAAVVHPSAAPPHPKQPVVGADENALETGDHLAAVAGLHPRSSSDEFGFGAKLGDFALGKNEFKTTQ